MEMKHNLIAENTRLANLKQHVQSSLEKEQVERDHWQSLQNDSQTQYNSLQKELFMAKSESNRLTSEKKVIDDKQKAMNDSQTGKIKQLDIDILDVKDKIEKIKAGLKIKFFDNTSGLVGNLFEKEINTILTNAGVGAIQ